MENLIAIYPGTFDPITKGHLDIIERASRIFDNLIIGVAYDTNKDTLFSLEERVKIAENEIEHLKSSTKNITVTAFNGLLVNFAQETNAKVILRGIRALSDFEYEFQMAFMNKKLQDDIETMFIPASENSHFISSRFVKELARLQGDLTGFVSQDVANKLIERLS